MENVSKHSLLVVTPENIRTIRQYYNIDDENKIQDSLNAIEEWIKKQDHLVGALEYLHRNFLERVIILSRGSVETTKSKLDKILTLRAMIPEINLNKSIDEFKNLDSVIFVPLPKLCPDESRVLVTQFVAGKSEDFNLLSYLRYSFLVHEYRLHYDYCYSERYIVDLKNVNINILVKLNPVIIKKAEIMSTEAYGSKIKGIHIVNAPVYVDKIVFILKQGLKEKVASRLYVHSSYEDLHKEIPKEILPVEYGGTEVSCSKLADQWKDCLKTKEARKLIDETNKLVADESKRNEVKFNEEYLGMPGSFRKLVVD